jgi:hypothetical protein
MKTIFKYEVKITGEQKVIMPIGAEIIHIGLDPNGTPCLWAMVDTGKELAPTEILLFGTGHPIMEKIGAHLGSFNDRSYVWHVFLK